MNFVGFVKVNVGPVEIAYCLDLNLGVFCTPANNKCVFQIKVGFLVKDSAKILLSSMPK